MQIYNSLTAKKESFHPIEPNTVKLYVCGQTVYDVCHIGHARSMIVFDMVVRFFQLKKYQVIYVRNITDIDDKIIARANQNNESCDALTQRFIDAMHDDEKALGLLPLTHEPRATEFIQPIIDLIQQLLDEKVAYIASNGDVCFEVRKYKDYGKLSKRDIEKLISGARVDVQAGKKDPLDFVLWKLSKPGEPQWDSPWGVGRPGWHIECSAMSANLLGQPFDIHGGGMDLKFPHHENEIAQSECAYRKPFANTWMHAGLLNVDGEKMSKSLNNFFTIRDVLKEHSAEVIRYFMLSAHYRSPVDYSADNMEKAKQGLTRWYTALRGLSCDGALDLENHHTKAFFAAMEDDFNSSVAFAVLFDMAHEINKLREENKIKEAEKCASQLKHCANVFGLLIQEAAHFLQGDRSDAFSAQIEQLIRDRNLARQQKNFKEADRIRAAILDLGVVIEDGASGTTWRRVM